MRSPMWIHMQKHHRHVLKILSFCNPYQRLVDYGNIKLPSMHQKTCEVQWACSSSTIQKQSIITMTTRTAKISVWSEIILCENVWLNKSPFWMRLRAKVQDNWQETEKVHIPHLGWVPCTQSWAHLQNKMYTLSQTPTQLCLNGWFRIKFSTGHVRQTAL